MSISATVAAPENYSDSQYKFARILACLAGVLGFLAFLSVPFLPVQQEQSSLRWPQGSTAESVVAPLISYTPETVDATVPLVAVEALRPGQRLILGTVPPTAEDANERGLFIESTPQNSVIVVSRGQVIAEVSGAKSLELHIAEEAASVRAAGKTWEIDDKDLRPMVTGIYTELGDEVPGLQVDIEINSRFSTSPTPLKTLMTRVGSILLLLAIAALWRMDRADGQGRIPLLPAKAWRPRLVDGVVTLVLGWWHIFGANTADDGYILTMARLSKESGYMANYYRWFGVPESPFGWPYYDLLAAMTKITTASTFMRLPALLSGLIIWFIISRLALPILGTQLQKRALTRWTAALVFLAFWLPYNNGTRPEPIIALGTITAWVCFERAIATKRLLPALLGMIIAAVSLATGPTGLMAVGAFLVALPQLFRVLFSRPDKIAQLAPFLVGGVAILGGVFRLQTFAAVLEATRVRAEIGPSLPWYLEIARYESLFSLESVDGSFTRRFAMFMLFASVLITCLVLLRYREIPQIITGPTVRLMLVFFAAVAFMTFTPTKWTHHFGTFAGLAAAAAAVGAVAISQIAFRHPRTRWLLVGIFALIFAFCLAGANAWWYVSSYGIPWWDKSIQYRGVEAASIMLLIAVIIVLAGIFHFYSTRTSGRDITTMARLAGAPIAVLSAVVVLFSCASFAKAFVQQYPAYSIGKGNLADLKGQTCALAADVLLETDTNDSFLKPLRGSFAESLSAGGPMRGFGPNNISDELENVVDNPQRLRIAKTSTDPALTQAAMPAGINGSTQLLPFNLDAQKVPVLGSWVDKSEAQEPAELTTAWYELPAEKAADRPLLVVSVAGKIAHHDADGILKKGQELTLEYGQNGPDGQIKKLGEMEMLDIGPSSSWRNLRLPLQDLPAEANILRLVAKDSSLDPTQWLAITPPRIPALAPMNKVIAPESAGLLDWPVALQFPCQRTFNHYAGVAEVPEYRISPDHPGKKQLSPVQNYAGGGVLGLAETLNYSYELPGYLAKDWARDWGSMEVYKLRTDSTGRTPRKAEITITPVIRSGLWNPSKMNIDTQD